MYPMPVFQENEMCKKRDLCKLSTSEEVCNPSPDAFFVPEGCSNYSVSYTHLRAHET